MLFSEKPNIKVDPSSISVDENERSVLTCAYETKSDKYTNMRWKKDGKYLNIDENGNILFMR